MNEQGKYVKLFTTIFVTFLLFIIGFILLMLSLRLIFGILDHIPWFSLLFTLFIICVPAVLFITVYLIYFARTKIHTSKPARIFSYAIFIIALASWAFFWIQDLIMFFKYHYNSIDRYNTFNLAFLSANIGVIFLVGIVQALSTEKEVDWMEKRKQQTEKLDTSTE
jgi:hypothetical protein